jgi:NTP pyrophosphatase (non-canonical NTP hydrolase)
MDKQKKLIERIEAHSGFFRENITLDYIDAVQSELLELKQAIMRGYRSEITDELGDFLMQGYLMYRKLKKSSNISPQELYRGVYRKYQHRAPHIFEGVTLTKEQEMTQWYKLKNE